MTGDLRYPVGPPVYDADVTPIKRGGLIAAIAALPPDLSVAVGDLSDPRLDTPYRPDGWTIRQLVHHVADSHMNAYIRFKLALTEDSPTIRAYDEAAWARLPDAAGPPIAPSLTLITALHLRWVTLLESMREEEFSRQLIHPERGPMTLDRLLQTYAWHGRHHTAHVTALRAREGW